VRTSFFAILLAASVSAGLAGCQSPGPGGRTAGGPVPRLDEASADAAGLLAREVSDATHLYVAKCMRCHKSYNPAEYSDAEWHSWMTKMSRKARLKPGQQELLSRYLEAFRAAHTGEAKEPGPGR
jgi:Dihaem cytochrome c